eukprot:gene31075-40415_t
MEISPNTQTRTLAYKNKSDGDEKESGEAPVKKNRLNRAQRKARLAAHLAANQAVLKREPESEILNLKRSVDPPAARIIKDAPMTASQKPRNPEKKPKVEQQQQQQENVVKKSNRAARRRNAPKKEIVNQSVGYREKVVIPAAVQHVNEMDSEPQVEEEGEAAADDDISLPPPPLSTINTNHFTTVTFDSLPISFNTKRALIEVMKYKYLTQTGTGKTLGFLIPAIDLLIQEKTRARQLCKFHKFGVVLLVGGTSVQTDIKALARLPAEGNNDIIVATPGRMIAHLEDTPGFSKQCSGIKVLILDEADRLLDMGFKREIDRIVAFLKPSSPTGIATQRQTLLFSDIQQVASITLRKGYKFIDTVPQWYLTVPLNQQVRVLVQLLQDHMQMRKAENMGFKVLVFFATARQTEIHSRKSQGARTRASDEFRLGKEVIMFSSDVSARGMDYPDVSLVVQVGTTSRDQYIHRLGRTARAGKS